MKRTITTIVLLTALLLGFAACEGGGFVDPGAAGYTGGGFGDDGYGGYGGGGTGGGFGYGGIGGGGIGGGTGGGTGGGGGSGSVPSTSGSLTITGLSAYNGKWVCAPSILGTSGDSTLFLVAYDSMSNNDTLSLAKISNGSATLKVWKRDVNAGKFSSYSGSDKNLHISMGVANKAFFSQAEANNMSFFEDIATGTVSFSGGKATVKFEGMMP